MPSTSHQPDDDSITPVPNTAPPETASHIITVIIVTTAACAVIGYIGTLILILRKAETQSIIIFVGLANAAVTGMLGLLAKTSSIPPASTAAPTTAAPITPQSKPNP